MISHAPSANLVTITIKSVIPVATEPRPLMNALTRAPESFDLSQWTTMPACDNVNARKAPTAKSGISLSVTPLKAINRIAARTAKTQMRWV